MNATYVIYALWALVPLFYVLSLLWAYLERAAGNKVVIRFDDYWKQAGFTCLAWVVYVVLDSYAIQGQIRSFIESFLPIMLFQLLLFPLTMLTMGTFIGGTRQIKIEKLAHVSKRPDSRSRR